MIILPFLHFFCFLVCAYLAVFVLYKSPKSLLNRTCSALLVSFAIWNFGDIFIHNSDSTITKETAAIFQNISSIGWIGFASALFCFSLAFSKREKLLKKKWFLFPVFILPLFLSYKQWTNCLTTSPLKQSFGWSFAFTDTISTYLFYIYYILFSLLSIYFIYSYGRKTKKNVEKKQAKIITFSLIISLILGTITDIVFPELGIYSVPSMGDIIILVFAVGLGLAIVKYKFITISLAIASENIISVIDELLILLNQEGNIITVNKATSDSLQYGQKELEGKSVTMLLQEDNFRGELLEKITKGEVIKNHDSDFLTKNGIKVPIIYSSSPLINGEGIVMGTVFIARDITERKQKEEELIRAKEKAEESDRFKTAFLQNMSHEIRTPLNAILGFSELLQNTTNSQEDILFFLEQIHYGKDDLMNLIEDVILASKIDTNQFFSNIKEFNLNDSLNELISDSKKLILRNDKSHIDFLTHIESTKDIIIEADENNIKMALRHIISNAIKYTDSGEIEIGTNLIDNNSEVEFYIRDTGIGVDKIEFEKIFDKFYKVESNQNKLFSGSGIGLTIVKGIAETYGGKVWVNSIVGEGSTFYFSIPVNIIKRKLKHHEPTIDTSKLIENWGKRNILIAEDVDINLKYLDKVLDFRNITRFHAKNGLEAVEIVKTVKIDLVLMDILMPLMDGYVAASIIKTMFPSILIIAQTAITFNDKDSNFLSLFNDYIVKPISPNSLIKVLDRFLKTKS